MKKIILLASFLLVFLFVETSYAAVNVTLLGPKQYERTTGSPNVYTDEFPGVLGTGRLTITNGDANGNNRVSSAVISINGRQVAGQNDFNQQVAQLEIQMNLVETNSLRVELRSSQGSFLSIQITQQIDAEAAAVIGPQGGMASIQNPSSPLDGASITIPSDALERLTLIYLRSQSPPSGLGDAIIPLLEIQPHNLRFLRDVTVKLPCRGYLGDPADLVPFKIVGNGNKLFYFEKYNLNTDTVGNYFITMKTSSLSWFGRSIWDESFNIFRKFPTGTIYYLHSEQEGGYPTNAFRKQRCTELNPCDQGYRQWVLNRETIDSAVRNIISAAVSQTCLQAINVKTVDTNVDTLEEFISFLNNHGGQARGLVIGFDDGGVLESSDIIGKFGYLSPSSSCLFGLCSFTTKVKTVLLSDRIDFYERDQRGWRIVDGQNNNNSNIETEYAQIEPTTIPGVDQVRETFSLENILLHEIGHAMGLEHDNEKYCNSLPDSTADPLCFEFPVMRRHSNGYTTAHHWESKDNQRLTELYNDCPSPACLRIDGEGASLPGWSMLDPGDPPTSVTVTTSPGTVHSGNGAMRVHGDFQIGRTLDSPCRGIVTIDYWHRPQSGGSTNSGLKVYGAQFSTSEFLTVFKNDQNLWWVSGVAGPVAVYNGQYTHIVITVNTNTGWFEVSINGQQVTPQVMVSNPGAISQGIQKISTWSGRGGFGTDSYFDDLVISSR